ncbi:hypothetical protein [Pantoea sp.]|uniref:hypothetical protein n=1 Tax=Pantoea sp. TaxID=69393 RepID=UPI0028AEC9E6|nr:hypothetical protein [Pantoea sp.]
MDFDLDNLKTAGLGLGAALSVGLNGWLAFGRTWVRTKASNANDSQQINMLQFLSDQVKELKTENTHLRDEIEERDQRIREYWKTITETESRLQIVESQLEALKQQNESLREELRELVAASTNMSCELARIKNAERMPR